MVALLLVACAMAANAANSAATEAEAAQDSTVDVIGWYSKNDTLDYWIVQSVWRFDGDDTTAANSMMEKVRIVVTDSTSEGYKMDYTILDILCDSVNGQPYMEFLKNLTDSVAKRIVGTTVSFETDEFGSLTKVNNVEQLEAIIDAIGEDTKAELLKLPEIQELVKEGFDLDSLANEFDEQTSVDRFLSELKLIFQGMGYSFKPGQRFYHEEASDSAYENDTHIYVEANPEDGNYIVATQVVNVIPRDDMKLILNGLVSVLGSEEISEKVEKGLEDQMLEPCFVTEYVAHERFSDGWPYKIVKQIESKAGIQGKITQTRILLNYISTNNY